MVNISYLITCHNEDVTLENLIKRVASFMEKDDEMIILNDFSDNPNTMRILSMAMTFRNAKVYDHALDKNYGGHKNYGNSVCKGDWIFQLDGDELPSETLLLNIKDIIEENPSIDLYAVPRVNDFKGVTPDHARQWGWRLTPCPEYKNRPIVNWPDYQGRIYKNNPKIKWDRRLHEKLEGYMKFANLPATVEMSLYHDKTIETQIKTNIRYNEWFTEEENRGHGGFKSHD
jgi:glycosyltransferase involved in cell wall biosynthesis